MRAILIAMSFCLMAMATLHAQDRIVFQDGTIQEGKVLEIAPDLISYKKLALPDGPVYKVNRSEVNSIVFENGTIELFASLPSVEGQRPPRNAKWENAPVYRSSFGIDLMSLAFRESHIWFEFRNPSGKIGHTLNLTGYWDSYFRYSFDDLPEDYYYYLYGGGMAVGYAPKIYFIQHRIARPYFAPEANLGFYISSLNGGYFRSMAKFGVALNPTPRFNINVDIGGGGYVIFDGFSNYGYGLLTFGLSLGMNYGKAKAVKADG